MATVLAASRASEDQRKSALTPERVEKLVVIIICSRLPAWVILSVCYYTGG